jgi:hypothetical protein
LVGDTSCNYIVLNKSINLTSTVTGNYNYVVNYSIDIDGDFINDINFDWYATGNNCCPSSWHQERELKCTSSSNYEFVYNIAGCNASTLVAANLSYSSAIKSGLNWMLNPPTSNVYYEKSVASVGDNWCGNYFPYYGPTNVYLGFRKILSNDTIYGWVFLKTRDNILIDKVVSYAYKHTASNSTITPVFTNSVAPIICQGSLINLSASPSGGFFYGLGVSGSTLNTAVCGGGAHTVYYNVGCGTAALTVTVDPPPIVFTNSLLSVCNGDSLVLTATPSGGIFSGSGVSGNTFHSSVPGLGNTVITYSYTDSNSCSATKTVNVSVLNSPSLGISPTSTIMLCPGNSTTLTATGASNYTWSTGSNNANIAISPTATTVYTLSGAFASGGCPSSIKSFTQTVGNPSVAAYTYAYPSNSICQGSSTTIYAMGAMSYSWSNGVNSYSFSANPTVTTTYSVIGTNPGGCTDTAVTTLIIKPNISITAVSSKSITCAGDTFMINLGGASAYTVGINDPWLTYSYTPSSIILTPTTNATYSIYAMCSQTVYLSHTVASCVGIEEVIDEKDRVAIYPNPTNGDFEIKGIKEETIYISNELGQLITTRNLSIQNNYSVKINDLQNGVYFVGNKVSRQKIVVIK